MNTSDQFDDTSMVEEIPQKILLLHPDYRLNNDGDGFELFGESVAFPHGSAIDNTVTVTAGGSSYYSVWGVFDGQPRPIRSTAVSVECFDEDGSLCGDDRAPVAASVSPGSVLNEGAMSEHVSTLLKVSGCIIKRKGPKKALALASICVAWRSNPQVKVVLDVRVVQPIALYLLTSTYKISADGSAILCNVANHHDVVPISPDAIAREYYVPLLGPREPWNIVALCSDERYRYLQRSELRDLEWEDKTATEYLVETQSSSCRDNFALEFDAIKASDQEFGLRLVCASNPRISTSVTLKIAVPRRLIVQLAGDDSPISVSADSQSLMRDGRKYKPSKRVAGAYGAATIGVGEERELRVLAYFSDERYRSLSERDYILECFALSKDGEKVSADGVRAVCSSLLATSHIADVEYDVRIYPRRMGKFNVQDLEEHLRLKTLAAVKAYLVREGRNRNLSFSPWDPSKSEALLRDDTPTFTIGVGDECAIDVVARYEDGSLRRVSPHAVKVPRYLGEKEIGYTHSPIDDFVIFRQVCALVVEGRRDFRGNFPYSTGIVGTDVNCRFNIEVSKIKGMHFVPWPNYQVLEFSPHGRPLDEDGREMADVFLMDDITLNLRVGEECRFAVMCEYANGDWGICNYHRYFARCTQGMELLQHGMCRLRPSEYVRKSSKVRAVLYSNRMTNAEMEVSLELPVELRLVIANSAGEFDLGAAKNGDCTQLKLGGKYPFAVVAVYADGSCQRLIPGEYIMTALGAGLRVWDGRRDEEWLDKLTESYATVYGRRRVLESKWRASEEETKEIYLEATKRTRRERVIELLVRLALRPSVCGACQVYID